ncbi:MAG: DNA-directed RNA polymerase subunit L [Candidatus Bathyarchaeia archaeon]
MKIKVLKKTENELRIEVEGAGHGLCNLLQKCLLEDNRVDVAGYDVPHPLVSNPIIYVRTKDAANPISVLMDAAVKARESNDTFSKELVKTLK